MTKESEQRRPNVNRLDVPPPMTTNRTSPRAQRGIGDCFASFSLRDAFTGFLPARALPLNCSFLWRISREEVDCNLSQGIDYQGEKMRKGRTMILSRRKEIEK